MLSIALPIMKKYGINPVVIICDKDNFGYAKMIINNGGYLVEEVTDDRT
jgi:predicted acetyltransferase